MRRLNVYVLAVAVLGVLGYFGIQADYKSFVGSLFAAGLSAFVVLFVEMELRPQLTIVAEETPHVHAGGRAFLRVVVRNRALWWPLKYVMDRRPAYQARAWITFLTESNDPVFGGGRRMVGRWSETPEPVRPLSVSLSPGGTPGIVMMRDVSVVRDVVDIGSGAGEILDVVMRHPNEDGCRGWHNRIIENPAPRPEDQFELPKGRYRALIRVETSGRACEFLFRIVCDLGITDFRLEPLGRASQRR